MNNQWYSVIINNPKSGQANYSISVSTTSKDHLKELTEGIRECVEEYPFTIVKIEATSSCFGCRENKPDQRSHMEAGGCLEEK